MNSPAVKLFAPSAHPALELIGLAQLSPEVARQRLRALLLANPNYFGKVPSTSFNSVLNIQEDTSYESIARLGYDPDREQLRAEIDIKQPTGYSSEILIEGSEEFVRFYLSYDGGLKWLDQGLRSVAVADAHWPRPSAYEVNLEIVFGDEFLSAKVPPKVRAILSWSTPPPSGSPNWKPVWGHVAESDIHMEDSEVTLPIGLNVAANSDRFESTLHVKKLELPMEYDLVEAQGHLSMHALHSTRTDPHHRFLAYVLAKAAGYCPEVSSDPRFAKSDSFQSVFSLPAFTLAVPSESTLVAIS